MNVICTNASCRFLEVNQTYKVEASKDNRYVVRHILKDGTLAHGCVGWVDASDFKVVPFGQDVAQ